MKGLKSSVLLLAVFVCQVSGQTSKKIWKKDACKFADSVTENQFIKLKVTKYPSGSTTPKLTIQNDSPVIYTLDKKKLEDKEFVIFIKRDDGTKDCLIDEAETELEVLQEEAEDKIKVVHGGSIIVLGEATNKKITLERTKNKAFMVAVEGAEETVKLKVDTVDIEVEANKKIFLKAPDADKTGSVVEIVDLKKDKTLTLTSYEPKLTKDKCQLLNVNKEAADHYIRLKVAKREESEKKAVLKILTTQDVTYNLNLETLSTTEFVLFVNLKEEPVSCELDKNIELTVVDLKTSANPVVGLGKELTVVGEATNKKVHLERDDTKKYNAKVKAVEENTKLKVGDNDLTVNKGLEKIIPTNDNSETEVEIVDLKQDKTLIFTYNVESSSSRIAPVSYLLLVFFFFSFCCN